MDLTGRSLHLIKICESNIFGAYAFPIESVPGPCLHGLGLSGGWEQSRRLQNAQPADFEAAIRLLEAREVPVDQAVNLVVPLEQATDALRSWSENPSCSERSWSTWTKVGVVVDGHDSLFDKARRIDPAAINCAFRERASCSQPVWSQVLNSAQFSCCW